MNLLQQVIQLLNESPGNLVYHLVTLFALQAVFAIAWSMWRRDLDNDLARRMVWSAAGIFLARFIWLMVSLLANGPLNQAASYLPPLEQAVHTITAVLLVWAIAPPAQRWPRLGNVLTGLGIIVVLIMYTFFAQAWSLQSAEGIPYNSTTQATIWSMAQIAVLTLGLLRTLQYRIYSPLHALIITFMLAAHLAHFWNYPEIIPTSSSIPYWIRLGQLAAFPLWAAQAYRISLAPFLVDPAAATDPHLLAQMIASSLPLLASLEESNIMREATILVGRLLPSRFVGIALLRGNDEVHLTSSLPQAGTNEPRQWQLPLDDLMGLRTTLQQSDVVELLPNGPGARQFHAWHRTLNLPKYGPLLIQPLQTADHKTIGALVVASPDVRRRWREPQMALADALARLIAQAVANGRFHQRSLAESASQPVMATGGETAVSGRLVAIEAERDELLSQLDTANARLLQAESREAIANRRSLDLANTLQALEASGRNEEIARLESEIEALRESLIEAEEAMALASAGEGGLSTEWVMMTITRYSGQLEAAQARIQTLEQALKKKTEGPIDDVVASLAQELRTPMTSISGYTDLLLDEGVGILGMKQREFLQRVRSNAVRMGELLNQLVQLTTTSESGESAANEIVDIQDVIDTAVSHTMSTIRHKNLRLDLDLGVDLPVLNLRRAALNQILTNLLNNASMVSPYDGHVSVMAHANTLAEVNPNGHDDAIRFIQIRISDSGPGVPPADWSRVFNAHIHADDPLIPGIADTSAGLAVARSLVEANGGRIWVDSEVGVGTNFTILFPIVAETTEAASTAAAEDGPA